ncbi:DsbA family protein [Pluralibacter gergoviae]|uniref:DsbA family protein n=1 Tax=Pluralibacter gergoviae TaxID=61647 RepID=UPI000A3B0DF0|nr:DsbA family protein [Pluralibacter gergoviae]EKT9640569.1 DsbA family protein [Pluralibacter gergoviae]EKV3541654.1 DsbA family protein [Pluralibacter gergoviae]EKV9897680.1 DsbA family protein [Pluralibacter gergoviae]EKV9930258.1 DsbA family protein [Pluralibacter gergoviae]EKW9978361.1 DsbA family protein [Pluralibacter gergoviae]
MVKKSLIVLLYTVLVAAISAVITTVYISSQYALTTKSENNDSHRDLIQLSQSRLDASPIKEPNTIIEFFSYGCHYCALHEVNVNALAARMPEGTRLVRLHLSLPGSGLSRYSSVFATLTVMGLEEQYRQQAYEAVLNEKLDIGSEAVRNAWLQKIGIDVADYNRASATQAAKDLEKYMADVSAYYDIRATPSFIVNKKWIALQDRKFPAFADNLLSLLQHDRPLEK